MEEDDSKIEVGKGLRLISEHAKIIGLFWWLYLYQCWKAYVCAYADFQ